MKENIFYIYLLYLLYLSYIYIFYIYIFYFAGTLFLYVDLCFCLVSIYSP